MSDEQIIGVKISKLDPIPSSWTEEQVREFVQRGLLPVSDSNTHTYKVPAKTLVKYADGSAYMVIRARKINNRYTTNHNFTEVSQLISRDYGVSLRIANDDGTYWYCYELSEIEYYEGEISSLIFKSVSETTDHPQDEPTAEATFTSTAVFNASNTLTVTFEEKCRVSTF